MTRSERVVIADRLREARDALGLTQQDVADALGIPRTAVSAMEYADRNLRGHELWRLARLYRRSVAWLLGEQDDPEIDPSLTRAVSGLTSDDRDTVLRFARFLAAQSGVGSVGEETKQ